MTKPKMIGNINARSLSVAWFRGLKLTFDGTTLDLATTLALRGAKVGEKVRANYGGISPVNAEDYKIIADGRDIGIWVARA